MLENGYIKIDRKIVKWCWYRNANTFKLFLHLLLTANYEDVPFEDIIVRRGQRVASFATLSAETGLSIKEVRVAINHLKRTNEVASLSSPKYTVFTINNYEKYQTGANIRANEGHTKGKRGANEGQQWKKDKERSKKEKEYSAPPGANKDPLSGGYTDF